MEDSGRRLLPPIKKDEKEEKLKICLLDNDKKEKNKNYLPSEDYKKEKKEGKLKCQKCGVTNKKLYICFDCELILCEKCKDNSPHDKMIEYELFNIIALYQQEKFTSYCETCKINLSEKCKSNHKDHLIKTFKNLKKDINLDELKIKICEIKKSIDNIKDKLNKIKENLDFYYEINRIISENLKNNKYNILEANEIINSNKTEIISEIDDIIYQNNFEVILNKFNKIFDFRIPSNGKNTEIVMKLKFEKNNKLKKLRIFGDKFVENNKQCKMYIEDKNYDSTIYDKNNNITFNTDSFIFTYEMIVSEINLKSIDIDLDRDIIIHLNSPNIITNLSFMFYNCDNLLSFVAISNYNNITNMSNMFYNCTSLNSLNMSKWNTSKVTDINGIFANCKKLDFESFSDISNWDTSNVIDMSFAFSNCESLKSLSKISNWNTSKVVKMNGMFKDCIHLNDTKDLKWDTSNVDNMNFMFCNCKDLVDISPISKLKFSKVIDMNNIFAECSSLEDISNFLIKDAPNVTDISYMFYNCIELKNLPEKLGFNENIITDISYMFYNTKLKAKNIKSEFLDNNRYQNADKTEILNGLNKNSNCILI